MAKKLLPVFMFGGGFFFSNFLLHGADRPLLKKVKMASRMLRPDFVDTMITNRGCQFVDSHLFLQHEAEPKNNFLHFVNFAYKKYKSGSPQVELVTRVIETVSLVSYGTFSLIAAGCNTCIDTLDENFSHRTHTQRFLYHVISKNLMPSVYNGASYSIIKIANIAGFECVANCVANNKKLVGFVLHIVLAPYVWKTIELVTNFKVNSESENKKRAPLSGDIELTQDQSKKMQV